MDKLYSITISVSTLAPFYRASPRVAAALFFPPGQRYSLVLGMKKAPRFFSVMLLTTFSPYLHIRSYYRPFLLFHCP
jgi:hypothetical protein